MLLNIRPIWRNEASEIEDFLGGLVYVFRSVVYQPPVFLVGRTGVFPLNYGQRSLPPTPL